MNQVETIGLWLQGKSAWNKWAGEMVAERKALELNGEWNAEKDLLGKLKANNEKTQAWLDKAKANFSSYVFYTNVNLDGFHFPGDADFGSTAFDKDTGVIERAAARFEGGARFDNAKFDGNVEFMGTIFEEGTSFKGTCFNAKAIFKGASFAAGANFKGAEFKANATFDGTTFDGEAIFDQASFGRYAWFVGTKFKSDVSFDGARFKKDVGFVGASFKNTGFEGTIFDADASFDRIEFKGDTAFIGTTFRGNAKFIGATFKKFAEFDGARFERQANFTKATFERDIIACGVNFMGNTTFDDATILGDAGFTSSTFSGATSFTGSAFFGSANFQAIRVREAFSLANAIFHALPDFTQSNFAVAPELSRMKLSTSVASGDFWGSIFQRTDKTVTAKYRALKRLAIAGHDSEQQQIFFIGEQRARRGSVDRGWHWRYWFGILFDLLSNYGRSLVRPLLLFIAVVLGFAAFYLGQHFGAAQDAARAYPISSGSYIAHRASETIMPALRSIYRAPVAEQQMPNQLSCLKDAGETTPLSAAIYLSLKKSLLTLVYEHGDRLDNDLVCLYGATTNFKGEIVPHISATVRLWSIVQSIISVSLIFFFLLALRNQFKSR